MKLLITADVHVHKHKKSDDRLQNCLQVLTWIFEQAQARGVNAVVVAGDLFHERQKLDVETYQLAFKIFQKYCGEQGMKAYLLMGNHDMYHKSQWDISSIVPLGAIPNVTVVNEPCTLNIGKHPISFLPYTENPIGDLRELSNKSDYQILFGHLAVDGAILNSISHSIADVPVEHDGDMVKLGVDLFKGWDQVFLGHYHCEQRLNPHVEYVGSPLQLSFGEAFTQKHVVVYDLETHEKEYVVNDFSPKHLIVKEKDLDKHVLKGNFVRLMVNDLSTTDIVDVRNKLMEEQQVGTIEVEQIPERANEKERVEDARAILFKKEEMISQYVELLEKEEKLDGLDKARLIEIGTRILEGKQANE
jgi:DNA repair exonuclease SbcCD nuclease subunit